VSTWIKKKKKPDVPQKKIITSRYAGSSLRLTFGGELRSRALYRPVNLRSSGWHDDEMQLLTCSERDALGRACPWSRTPWFWMISICFVSCASSGVHDTDHVRHAIFFLILNAHATNSSLMVRYSVYYSSIILTRPTWSSSRKCLEVRYTINHFNARSSIFSPRLIFDLSLCCSHLRFEEISPEKYEQIPFTRFEIAS
jgi:hypothetical protein